MDRIWALLPLAIAFGLGGFLFWGLSSDRDPNEIPSALIGQGVPDMTLDPIPQIGGLGFDPDVIEQEELALVNVFASWCVPCRAEHAPLTRMSEDENLPIYGINYRDQADDAAEWLNELGNPYKGIGHDIAGRAGIEWGISGVPETFIVKNGVVVHRHVGPIVGDVVTREFRAALDAARAE